MQMDNKRVRASNVCPLCSGQKDTMLVACWPCYREHGLKYGNPAAEARISAAEARLKSANSARS